jgi:hypothetical protein
MIMMMLKGLREQERGNETGEAISIDFEWEKYFELPPRISFHRQ